MYICLLGDCFLCPRFSGKPFLDFRGRGGLIFGDGLAEVETVAGSLIPPLLAASMGGADDLLGQQPFDRGKYGALAQACAMVKGLASARGNTTGNLAVGRQLERL